ncbi:FAD-dependent oxidoreductase [Schlegelella sp. S2-27]|uniref:FAD-dependent oxidoreductase n=1 Tax=Caldimonas mangrovi TaxID=2944811 RepID=A0ABT0YLN2_9BURK|nr:FAD-dependent oxidoreductase [Caldimonas mangrovi]MCM5679643.1 FAD-dependent oxidoreductase [Caldimonas mangrovi]
MKRLLLLGAGHSHLAVLQALAAGPWAGVHATLVSPQRHQIYTGMLPGWAAGHYALDECRIDLLPLVRDGHIEWLQRSAAAIEADARQVRLDDGHVLGYDVLSVDVGSVSPCDAIDGAAEHALALRPLERLVAQWDRVARSAARGEAVVVVGGGAGGAELAMALRHRLPSRAPVVLVSGGQGPVPGYPPATRRRVRQQLERLGVACHDAACTHIGPRELALSTGALLQHGVVLLAVGAAAPPWLRASGLKLTHDGFIATGATLQSVSHPEVFAAGDVATRIDCPHPKSGVYAVRAGPPLARNLHAWLEGRVPHRYRPQRRSLNLLSCGERYAIASWGRWCWAGRWVWRWKDRIDRAFVERHAATGRAAGR